MFKRIIEGVREYLENRRSNRALSLFEERNLIEQEIRACIEARDSILDHIRQSEWCQQDEETVKAINADLQGLRTRQKEVDDLIDKLYEHAA